MPARKLVGCSRWILFAGAATMLGAALAVGTGCEGRPASGQAASSGLLPAANAQEPAVPAEDTNDGKPTAPAAQEAEENPKQGEDQVAQQDGDAQAEDDNAQAGDEAAPADEGHPFAQRLTGGEVEEERLEVRPYGGELLQPQLGLTQRASDVRRRPVGLDLQRPVVGLDREAGLGEAA